MKRFEISFEFTSSLATTVDATSIQEAIYNTMKKLSGLGHIEPKEGSIQLREIPFVPRVISVEEKFTPQEARLLLEHHRTGHWPAEHATSTEGFESIRRKLAAISER